MLPSYNFDLDKSKREIERFKKIFLAFEKMFLTYPHTYTHINNLITYPHFIHSLWISCLLFTIIFKNFLKFFKKHLKI